MQKKSPDDDSNDRIIVILADSREFNSMVVKDLVRLYDDCRVKPKRLEVGDYICSDRVGVERKTAKDFVSSVIDRRLFDQVVRLVQTFERPVLIIEGHDLYGQRAVHPNAIRGALASIAIDYKLPIIWTRDEVETADMLFWIAKREQITEQRRAPSVRGGERKPLVMRERQEFLVGGLPDVSTVLSRRLLKKFKTPRRIFDAKPEKLMKVEKLGKKKAKTIWDVLNSEY